MILRTMTVGCAVFAVAAMFAASSDLANRIAECERRINRIEQDRQAYDSEQTRLRQGFEVWKAKEDALAAEINRVEADLQYHATNCDYMQALRAGKHPDPTDHNRHVAQQQALLNDLKQRQWVLGMNTPAQPDSDYRERERWFASELVSCRAEIARYQREEVEIQRNASGPDQSGGESSVPDGSTKPGDPLRGAFIPSEDKTGRTDDSRASDHPSASDTGPMNSDNPGVSGANADSTNPTGGSASVGQKLSGLFDLSSFSPERNTAATKSTAEGVASELAAQAVKGEKPDLYSAAENSLFGSVIDGAADRILGSSAFESALDWARSQPILGGKAYSELSDDQKKDFRIYAALEEYVKKFMSRDFKGAVDAHGKLTEEALSGTDELFDRNNR